MNILNDKQDQNHVDLHQMEHVEQEKMEYKLIDTFLRTPGLKLWFYNPETEVIEEVISQGMKLSTAQLVIRDGVAVVEDYEHKSLNIDPRDIYFEALNWQNAEKRVKRYESGKIKELCNLRKPSSEGIKFW